MPPATKQKAATTKVEGVEAARPNTRLIIVAVTPIRRPILTNRLLLRLHRRCDAAKPPLIITTIGITVKKIMTLD